MIQLVLLLLGAEAVRRHWLTLVVVGAIWIETGLVIVIDPLDGVQDITMRTLGALLMVEGLVGLAVGALANARRMWLAKGLALVAAGLMVVVTPWRNDVFISVLFGLGLLADGTLRAAGTLVVRFQGWRTALVGSALEFVLAALALTPWPVSYEATVPFCVGIAFILTGWSALRSGLMLRQLPPDSPVTLLPIFAHARGWRMVVPGEAAPEPGGCGAGGTMTVHVWTPRATTSDPRLVPLLDRYVAAVDQSGAVATGHAALEAPPDLYISHYPAEDLEHGAAEFQDLLNPAAKIQDPSTFGGLLNAGAKNDVAGRFLPSHAAEVAGWCEPTARVAFTRFNAARLRAFWAAYRADTTYNLTNRNCSVVVAMALDAALEGALGGGATWPPLLRLLTRPHLYLATLLRRRAEAMTWTPGLLLDYASALHRVVEPAPQPWFALVANAAEARRTLRLHKSVPNPSRRAPSRAAPQRQFR